MIRFAMAGAAAVLLGGCASLTPDAGMDRVADLTRERTGQSVKWQRSAVDATAAQARSRDLTAQPLSADAAVELAFLGNRSLQAQFAELGIADADRVQAGRPKNPLIGFSHLAGGGALEIDRSVLFSVLNLLTLPAAAEVAGQRFEQAQLQAASDAVGLAAQTRSAYFGAVAAQQLAVYAAQVKDAAQASAELARRMALAGNFSRLDQLREQAFYAEATARLARARQDAVASRERLTRLLGGAGDPPGYQLPERLADLPASPLEPRDAEQTAMDRRLDVLGAKRRAAATARSLGLVNASRLVNVLDVGWQTKDQTGTPRETGYQVQLELPLFDLGQARSARAGAVYGQALDRAAAVALNARSEVREAYAAYRTSFDLARHYRDEVVPLRQRIAAENLLRYNGMLIGVFELIADAREQVAGVTAYVEALRDHWLAETRLQTALAGGSPATDPSAAIGP